MSKVTQPDDKIVTVTDWPSYHAVIRLIEQAADEDIIETINNVDDEKEVKETTKRILDRQNKYDFVLREMADFGKP